MLLGAYASALLYIKAGAFLLVNHAHWWLVRRRCCLGSRLSLFQDQGGILFYHNVSTGHGLPVYDWLLLKFTGGWDGVRFIPPPNPITIPGITTLTFDTDISYYYLAVIIVGIGLFVLYRMERARIGLVWGQ